MIAWVVVSLLSSNAQVEPLIGTRLVIGTSVVCRAQPDRDSAIVAAHRLGEPLTVRGITRDRTGAEWYEVVTPRSCWVSASLTVALADYASPDTALMAIADHALALDANATFDHLIAVDNLLLERRLRRGRFLRAPDVSPLLDLRHLQIVDRAARTIDGRRATAGDPVRNAWVLAHSDVVKHFEPGDLYHVPGSHFWALFEQHRTSPAAEEIAWTAATSPVFTDECMTACHLNVLSQSYMPYWSQFPRGRYLLEAIANGVRRVDRAARFCPLVAGQYLQEPTNQIRTLIDRLRESLQDVTVAGKEVMLGDLSEIETVCLDSTLDLDSPQAIPALAKALGLGFSIVPRQLAEFGEQAAPTVLAIVTSAESDRKAVHEGLMALRFMVQGAGLRRPLSAATRQRITQAADQWLAAQPQSILTLGRAIDLAAVLGDPDLRRVLQSLASDPNAVALRGINAGSIDWIRKLAADRLAGVPPLPRP